MAVLMAVTGDVFVVTYFMLSFPTGCFGWDLGWNCVSSREYFPSYFHEAKASKL